MNPSAEELEYIATLGPRDQPNGTVKVKLLGSAQTPSFRHVVTEHGEHLCVHENSLRLMTGGEVERKGKL